MPSGRQVDRPALVAEPPEAEAGAYAFNAGYRMSLSCSNETLLVNDTVFVVCVSRFSVYVKYVDIYVMNARIESRGWAPRFNTCTITRSLEQQLSP